jgi:HlyD family secretion protein
MDRKIEIKRVPIWRRPLFLGTAFVVAFVIAILRWLPADGSTNVNSGDIETGIARRAAFNDYLPLRAIVAPRTTTLVGAMSGGQVEQLLAQDGATVAAGQPLAMLANPELKLDIITREAQIASQLSQLSEQDLSLERNRLEREGQIAQASHDLIKARRDLAVREYLHAKGLVADVAVKNLAEDAAFQRKRLSQLETGQETETAIARNQSSGLADARARLASNLAALRSGLDALVIRAPLGGRLTNFTIQPGQTLKAGDSAGQIDSIGFWKLIAEVDEFNLGRVALGQEVVADDGARLTVSKVLPAVINGRFRIELTYVGPPPRALNRGQTLDIRLTLSAVAQTLIVPVGGWLDAGGGASAYVLDADGRYARRRNVRVGRRNPEVAEILSGLRPGERIIVSNTKSLKSNIVNIR